MMAGVGLTATGTYLQMKVTPESPMLQRSHTAVNGLKMITPIQNFAYHKFLLYIFNLHAYVTVAVIKVVKETLQMFETFPVTLPDDES